VLYLQKEQGKINFIITAADDPVAADDADAVEGSGGGGGGGLGFVDFFPSFFSRSMRENRQIRPQECDDRIVMPCDSEDLIPDNPKGPGICDLLHCGNSFCSLDDGIPGTAACRIESKHCPDFQFIF
jgi:hypothetical protein